MITIQSFPLGNVRNGKFGLKQTPSIRNVCIAKFKPCSNLRYFTKKTPCIPHVTSAEKQNTENEKKIEKYSGDTVRY